MLEDRSCNPGRKAKQFLVMLAFDKGGDTKAAPLDTSAWTLSATSADALRAELSERLLAASARPSDLCHHLTKSSTTSLTKTAFVQARLLLMPFDDCHRAPSSANVAQLSCCRPLTSSAIAARRRCSRICSIKWTRTSRESSEWRSCMRG